MKKFLLSSLLLSIAAGFAFAQGVALDSPNGGEQWKLGSTELIRWHFSSDIEQPVRIVLLKDLTLVGVIAEYAPSAMFPYSFEWKVGTYHVGKGAESTVPPGTYRIGIKTADQMYTSESKSAFTIFSKSDLPFSFAQRLANAQLSAQPESEANPDILLFDLKELADRLGDPGQDVKLVLLQNGRQLAELGQAKAGIPLAQLARVTLTHEASAALQSAAAGVELALIGADGKILHQQFIRFHVKEPGPRERPVQVE